MSLLKLILLLILIPILAFIVIHVFALFGIFVAISYFIVYFIFTDFPPCLMCNKLRQGEYCSLCHNHAKDNKTPQNIKSLILNTLIILFLSILSMFIVFGERYILDKTGYIPITKTVNFAIEDKGQFKLNELFPMVINLTGIKTPINAIQADIKFDPSRIQIEDITIDNSIAEVFIQKEIDNEKGFARITGGLPNPGYQGENARFATVLMKGVNPGLTEIEFLPSSMVLANDGKGTDTLKEYSKISYLILPTKISPEEEAIQETSIGAAVLGTSTDNTKIVLYNDNKPQVLGDIDPDTKNGNADNSIIGFIFNYIIAPISFAYNAMITFITNFWIGIHGFLF